MPLTRAYIALDAAGVVALRTRREITPAPVRAHVAAGRVGADVEEAEYAALRAAAADSGALRAPGSRRVVAAVDVESALVTAPEGDAPDSTAVEIGAPVPLRRVVSFHIDELPGGTEDADLLWYDVTELDDLVDILTARPDRG